MTKELSIIGDEDTAVIILLSKNRRILFGHRHYKDDSVWTMPGGRCDTRESLEETLKREVEEETGIKDFIIIKFLGKFKGVWKNDVVFVFYGTTNKEYKLIEPDKFSEWRWISKEEFIKNDKFSGFNPIVREATIKFIENVS